MTHVTTAAIVLAGGIGSRMRRPAPGVSLDAPQAAAAMAGLKGMIPDGAGRPFLAHVLSSLADAGIREVCLVVAPDHRLIAEYFAAHPPERVTLTWAVQAEAAGTANAVRAAESWAARRDVLVLNADNLYPVAAIRALVELGSAGLVAFDAATLVAESNIEPERILAFALVERDANGLLRAIHEKPDPAVVRQLGASAAVSMNLWRVDATIVAACARVPRSSRGEFELPQAVALAVSEGHTVQTVPFAGGVLDLSRQDDIMGVAARLATRPCQP